MSSLPRYAATVTSTRRWTGIIARGNGRNGNNNNGGIFEIGRCIGAAVVVVDVGNQVLFPTCCLGTGTNNGGNKNFIGEIRSSFSCSSSPSLSRAVDRCERSTPQPPRTLSFSSRFKHHFRSLDDGFGNGGSGRIVREANRRCEGTTAIRDLYGLDLTKKHRCFSTATATATATATSANLFDPATTKESVRRTTARQLSSSSKSRPRSKNKKKNNNKKTAGGKKKKKEKGGGKKSGGKSGGGGNDSYMAKVRKQMEKRRKLYRPLPKDNVSMKPDSIFASPSPSRSSSSDEDGATATTPPSTMPPLFLSPTSSPNVFVSRIVKDVHGIDPYDLFSDVTRTNYTVPPIFRGSSFHYFASSPQKRDDDGHAAYGSDPPNEVAFLGRSNVGKSSLINAIITSCGGGGGARSNSDNLARISKQPGRTQHVHYFGLVPVAKVATAPVPSSSSSSSSSSSKLSSPNKNLMRFVEGYLVDLPGYGFAVGPDEAVDKWQERTQKFLLRRRDAGTLRRLFLLLDSRRGPTQLDQTVMTWFDRASIPYTVVFTKADTVIRGNNRRGKSTPTQPKPPTLGSGMSFIVQWMNYVAMRYQQKWTERYGDDDDDDDDDDDEAAFHPNEIRDYKEQQRNQPVMLSPIIHLTSSKTNQGISELLSSIEAEFLTVAETDYEEYDDDDDDDDDDDETEEAKKES